jgi:hypothetical protein
VAWCQARLASVAPRMVKHMRHIYTGRAQDMFCFACLCFDLTGRAKAVFCMRAACKLLQLLAIETNKACHYGILQQLGNTALLLCTYCAACD